MAVAQVKTYTPEEIAESSVEKLAAMPAWPRRMCAKAVGLKESAYDNLNTPEKQAEAILAQAQEMVGGSKEKKRTPVVKEQAPAAVASKRQPRNSKKEPPAAAPPQEPEETADPQEHLDLSSILLSMEHELKELREDLAQMSTEMQGLSDDLARSNRMQKAQLAALCNLSIGIFGGSPEDGQRHLRDFFSDGDSIQDPS